MTPLITLDSLIIPPGIFSILAYLLISALNLLVYLVPFKTILQESKAKLTTISPQFFENLVPIHE